MKKIGMTMKNGMKKTTKGVIVGAAGVALLAGGSTFALWSFESGTRPPVVYTGDMYLEGSTASWYDVSDGSRKTVDPNTFRATPGDKLQLEIPLKVRASGTNAAPTFKASLGATAERLAKAGATATYSLVPYDANGLPLNTVIPGAEDVAAGTAMEAVIPTSTGMFDRYRIVVDLDMSADSSSEAAGQLIDVGAVTYSLTQARK